MKKKSKILIVMKISSFLLFVCIFSAFAAPTNSQNAKVNINGNNLTIGSFIDQVEKQTDYLFVYSKNEVNTSDQLSVKSGKKSVATCLNEAFKNSDIKYAFENDYVILTKNVSLTTTQQDKTISGTVFDKTGEPIIGANVVIKGSSERGTITDAEGRFTLLVPKTSVLVVSYIGYLTKEISVGNQSVISVVLEEDVEALGEVVVVGYGVSKKTDLTGSVTSVTLEDVSKQPIINVGEALRGKAPGVQITQQNAAPGSGMKMRIRGANSINGNNDPLYVIDGFVGGDYTTLNANDIESISVLKDASATSMYGSRGSNGVVLITTKQAKEGESKVEYNGFVSFDQAAKKLDVLNATEFMTVANERQSAIGANPFFTSDEISAVGKGINWQDEILRTGITQNHQLSLSGGQQSIKYYLSGTYQDQQGIVINSFYKRYGFKSNLNSKIRNNFDVAFNFNGNYNESRNNSTYDGRNSPMGQALVFPACVPIKDANGEYNTTPAGYGPVAGNPVFSTYDGTDGGSNGYGMRMLGNLTLNWTIVDGLKLSVSGGTNLISTKSTSKSLNTKDETVNTTISSVSDGMSVSYQNTNQLSFNKIFNDIHKVDAAIIYEQQKYIYRSLYGSGTGFPTSALGANALGLASTQETSSSYSEWSLQSYLGRVNYTLMDKYLFTVSMRIDGSSKFAEGNKYGYFPSGAIAWRMSEEDFIKRMNIFQNLKIRASYGKVGSQAINPYTTLQKLAFGNGQGNNYQYDNKTNSISIAPSSPSNVNLKWESTAQTDIGLDFGVLNGRLSGSLDYYYKKTTDLLMNVTIPAYLYGGSQLQNVGSLENKGFEIALNGIILDNKDWYISTGANIGFNKNKVLDLGSDEPVFVSTHAGWTNYNSFSVLQEGKPMGQMYGLTYLGTWKSNEAEEATKYGKVPGDAKYLDVDGNHTIDGKDMDVIGKGLPDFTWSWNFNMSYKSFDLNMIVNGVQGNDVWNFTRFLYEGQNSDVKIPTSTAMLNRWSTSNEQSNIPTFSSTNVDERQSSRWLEDGSYIRLSNITLGYTFNKLKKNTFVKDAKIYISGQNLLTITNYSGYNPEASVTSSGQDTAIGYDFAGYPALRSYVVGVKFSF